MHKINCSKCDKRKLRSSKNFYPKSRICKPCIFEYHRSPKIVKYQRKYRKEYRARPESIIKAKRWHRKYKLKRLYNITVNQHKRMVLRQRGKCKICKSEKPLVIDHCHSTGVVRGLLCRTCNFAIGAFKDDAKIIKGAIRYLSCKK